VILRNRLKIYSHFGEDCYEFGASEMLGFGVGVIGSSLFLQC
jgi:hypothetical protein